MKVIFALPVLTLVAALLTGCDLLGIESPEKIAAVKEADGKAVGGACRHATRAIEDCYALNPKAMRSAVFTGWREMDEYMRENKLEGIAPQMGNAAGGKKGDADAEPADKPAKDGAKGGKDAAKAAGKDSSKPAAKDLKEAKEAKDPKAAKP